MTDPAPRFALFGCNPMAIELARHLFRAEVPFLMLEQESALVEIARREGFDAQTIDFSDDFALRAVGIDDFIDGVFCLLPEDSRNVLLTISIRTIAPHVRIVATCHTRSAASILRAAGANRIVDPYEISGARVHELIEHPEIVDLLEQTVFGQQDLRIAEIRIPTGYWVNGLSLARLRLFMPHPLLLLGLVDMEMGRDLVFGASGLDHKLDSDDVLVVIGPNHSIESFQSTITSPHPPSSKESLP